MDIVSQSLDLKFLRTHASKETLQILATEIKTCLECGNKIEERDGELVCTRCGIVWGNGFFENNKIPFEERNQRRGFEGHWSPPNQLAFNKGMGTNQFISRGSFCRIIAPVNKKDLGVRAIQLRNLTSKVEHPWIVRLLYCGSQICKQFGLHTKDVDCIRFSDQYGKVLRSLGAFMIMRGRHWNELKRTAQATFIVLYSEFAGEKKAREAWRQLGVDASFVRYARFLMNALMPKHRKKDTH